MSKEGSTIDLDLTVLYILGAALILVGFIIIFIAVFSLLLRSTKRTKSGSAGFILIGPIPIASGTNKKSMAILLLLSLALTMAMIILYALLR